MKFRILLMISLLSISLTAQNKKTEEFYIQTKNSLMKATSSWDLINIHKYKSVFERLTKINKEDYLSMYYLAYANFSICTMKETPTNRVQLIESAISILEEINKNHPEFEESQILLSSVLTYKMSYNRDDVIQLFQKSSKALSIAKSINNLNPRLYYVSAVNKFYTPKSYGGGEEEAIKLFHKSISLFENYKKVSDKMPDWGLAESYHWLGYIYYKKLNQDKNAIEYFKKALIINPNLLTARSLLSEIEKNKEK